jgi:hypothetical protein
MRGHSDRTRILFVRHGILTANGSEFSLKEEQPIKTVVRRVCKVRDEKKVSKVCSLQGEYSTVFIPLIGLIIGLIVGFGLTYGLTSP